MKKQRIVFTLLLLINLLSVDVFPQSVYYVSPSSTSESKGGSQASPLNSIHKAIERIKDDNGDVIIYLREGKCL